MRSTVLVVLVALLAALFVASPSYAEGSITNITYHPSGATVGTVVQPGPLVTFTPTKGLSAEYDIILTLPSGTTLSDLDVDSFQIKQEGAEQTAPVALYVNHEAHGLTLTIASGSVAPMSSAATTVSFVGSGTIRHPMDATTSAMLSVAIANPGASGPPESGSIDGVTFTRPVSAMWSGIGVSPTTIVADGVATSTVTVTVRDMQYGPVQGATVTLAQTNNGHSIIGAASGTSDASGVVTFTVRSSTVETAAYAATANSILLDGRAYVTFTSPPVDAGNSEVVASPTTVIADGAATSTVTVTVRDGGENPVQGATVTLDQGDGHSDIGAASGTSNASGVVTFTVRSSTVETVTYTATANSVPITNTAQLTFTKVPTPNLPQPVAPTPPEPEPEPTPVIPELPTFEDVSDSSVHADGIAKIRAYGITGGTTNTTFSPSGNLSREQMSSFMVRLLVLSDPTIEVPDSHAAAMQLLVERGLLQGNANGELNGSGMLTRGQAASLLARLIEDVNGEPLATGTKRFPDAGVTHGENIAKLTELGIISGYADETFRPSIELRRDQMASLIGRTIDELIKAGKITNLDT